MLDRISTALVPCYLSNLKWDLFHQYADDFMGDKVEQVQADLHHLVIKNDHCTLRARRHTSKPDDRPWNIHMSLSFDRNPGPFDIWLGVQFAKDICLATGSQSYCDIPSEVAIPNTSSFWQLTFYQAPNDELLSEIIQLQKVDDEHLVEIGSKPVDLRNYELFQTRLPYR